MIPGHRKWSPQSTRHLVLVSTLLRMASKHHQSNQRFGSSVAEDRQNRFSAGFFKIIDEVILGFSYFCLGSIDQHAFPG
jgi:hypothetical protein